MSLMLLGCGGGGGAAAPFLLDTFTDANDTALTSHTPDSGGTWIEAAGSGATIQSNGAFLSEGFMRHSVIASGADGYAIADLTQVGADDGHVYLIGRWGGALDDTGSYYAVTLRNVFGTLSMKLIKLVGGSQTDLDTHTPGALPSTIELRMVGSAITAKADNAEVMSATDSDISAAGYFGLAGQTGDPSNYISVDRVRAFNL